MTKQIFRKHQGELIAQAKGSIRILDDRNYIVNSQSGNDSYHVQLTEHGANCSCPDYSFRGVKCKHIHAIEFSFMTASLNRPGQNVSPLENEHCFSCKNPTKEKTYHLQ